MTEEIKEFILYLINPKNPFLFLNGGTIINVDADLELTLEQVYESWKKWKDSLQKEKQNQ